MLQILLIALHGAALSGECRRRGNLALLQRQIRQRRFLVAILCGIHGARLALHRLSQQRCKAFCALRGHGRFARRGNHRLGQILLGALVHHVKLADGVDLIVKELHAHSAQAVRRIDIHDAAAHGELPPALDHELTRIAAGKQPLDQLIHRQHIAHAHADRVAGKDAARHQPVQQRIRRTDDGARFADDQLVQRLNAAARHLAAGGHFLIKRDLSGRKQADAAAHQRGEILHRRGSRALAVCKEQKRPARLLRQRARQMHFLRPGKPGRRNHSLRFPRL